MPPKRKQSNYTVAEKLQTILRIQNGKTQAKVSKEKGIPESTLRGWLKDESKIRKFADEVDTEVGLSRKRARLAEDPVLDKAMYDWFVAKRSDGIPLSGPLIMAQATQMSQTLHESDQPLALSSGWLNRFKQRHGIRSVKVSGEIRSSDLEAAEAFLPELQRVVESEGLVPAQIYNCDETGLNWRMTPDRTLAERSDPTCSQGHKQAKDRATVLLACNWEGSHKLPLLVVGKSRAPRCFHHVRMDRLPYHYTNSKTAWMTGSIFAS